MIGLYDLIVTAILLVGILLIAFFIKEIRYAGETCKVYFMPGLLLKILGSIFFCFVYTVYYTGGDTIMYWQDSVLLRTELLRDFKQGWEVLTTAALDRNLSTQGVTDYLNSFGGETTFYVSRITAVLSLFTGGSFLATTVLFGALSYTGVWALYRVFIKQYPSLVHPLALAVVFVPSVIFWGSGILKDTITMGCLGWLTYGIYHVFIARKQLLLSIIVIPISFHLTAVIKGFILAAYLPGAFAWLLFHYTSKVREAKLIAFSLIMLFSFTAIFLYYFSHLLTDASDMALSFLIGRASEFQGWHAAVGAEYGGSSYSLGDWEPTYMGILKKVPASINVTFFRPYLFEVSSSVQLVSAIESFGVLLLAVFALLSAGIFRSIKMIFGSPFLFFCFFFSMSYAFATGFASYNFGALVRYKIPCMPFFLALLIILLFHRRIQKTQTQVNN